MAKKDREKAAPELRYEQVRSRLEEVVARLERGEGTLDESLALYEEGVSLIRTAHGILDAAEKRLELLRPRPDGSFALEEISQAELRPDRGAEGRTRQKPCPDGSKGELEDARGDTE